MELSGSIPSWSALHPQPTSPSVLILMDPEEGRAIAALLAEHQLRTVVPPQLSLGAGRAKYADVVLIDLSGADGSAVEVCRAIKLRYPNLPVIGIVKKGDRASVRAAADLQLDDFLCKSFSEDELLARISARVRGRETHLKISRAADSYQSLFDMAAAGLFVMREGWFSFVNGEFARLFGYRPEEISGLMTIHDLVVPEQRFVVGSRFQEWMESEVPTFRSSFSGLRQDGRSVEIELYATRMLGEGRSGYGGTVLDITRRRQVEAAKQRQANYFQALIERAHDIITVIEPDGTVKYESPSVEPVLGYTPEELVGSNVLGLVHPDDLEQARSGLSRMVQSHGLATRLRFRSRSGEWRVLEVSARDLQDDPVVQGIVLNSRDVTDQQAAEEALRIVTLTDRLTGLPNRTLLSDRLSQAQARARRHGSHFAILFLDLDGFKIVNDGLGHAVGDALLVAVARRLQSLVRAEDTVARFGGDEFGILLPDVAGARESTRLAQRILDSFSHPFDAAGHEVFTSPSIGIVTDSIDQADWEQVLRNADVAMYRAKTRGAAYEMFDPAMHHSALRRMRIETDLRRAVSADELRVHYQPIIALKTGEVAGFEALMRWQHPSNGFLPPDEFICVAEETGQIEEMGRWVLERACESLREWQEVTGRRDLWVAVNLSSRQLRHSGLVRHVRDCLAKSGLKGSNLKLEITESMVIEDTDRISATLTQLKKLDLQLYMDDFGTGYASLGYLHRLPIDGLKIDRSFVSPMHTDPRHAVLVESSVRMAAGLGLKIVAEGIEQGVHQTKLTELGCDFGQGYFFSRPVEASAAIGLLHRNFLQPVQYCVSPGEGVAAKGKSARAGTGRNGATRRRTPDRN